MPVSGPIHYKHPVTLIAIENGARYWYVLNAYPTTAQYLVLYVGYTSTRITLIAKAYSFLYPT